MSIQNFSSFFRQIENFNQNPIKISNIEYFIDNVKNHDNNKVTFDIILLEERHKGVSKSQETCLIVHTISNIIIRPSFPFIAPFLQYVGLRKTDCDESMSILKEKNQPIEHKNHTKMHRKIDELQSSWKPVTTIRDFVPKIIKVFRKIMNELSGVTTSHGAVSVLFDDYLVRNDDSRGNMPGAEKNTEINWGQHLRSQEHIGRRIQSFMGGKKKKKQRKTKKRRRKLKSRKKKKKRFRRSKRKRKLKKKKYTIYK